MKAYTLLIILVHTLSVFGHYYLECDCVCVNSSTKIKNNNTIRNLKLERWNVSHESSLVHLRPVSVCLKTQATIKKRSHFILDLY